VRDVPVDERKLAFLDVRADANREIGIAIEALV
jgi:hypothetical protein